MGIHRKELVVDSRVRGNDTIGNFSSFERILFEKAGFFTKFEMTETLLRVSNIDRIKKADSD